VVKNAARHRPLVLVARRRAGTKKEDKGREREEEMAGARLLTRRTSASPPSEVADDNARGKACVFLLVDIAKKMEGVTRKASNPSFGDTQRTLNRCGICKGSGGKKGADGTVRPERFSFQGEKGSLGRKETPRRCREPPR